MARTDTLGNFLTDVAEAIRTKKGTTDTIQASNFDTEIANLPSGGGRVPIVNTKYLGYYEVTGTTATRNILNFISGYPSYYPYDKIGGVVSIYVRSDYTLSDNLIKIDETEWFTDGSYNQKLIVCWCEDLTQDFTVTQTTSGRIGILVAPMKNTDVPISILNDTTKASTYPVSTSNETDIYFCSSIYGDALSSGNLYSIADDFIMSSRQHYIVSYFERTFDLPNSGGGAGIIGIRCPYKEASE